MRKIQGIRFFLVILVLLCVISGIGFAEKSTWSAILDAMEKETGYPADAFSKGQLVEEKGRYTFSVILVDHASDSDGMFVGEWSSREGLSISKYPESISVYRQMQIEMRECFRLPDCYERLMEFSIKWKHVAEGKTKEELASNTECSVALLHFLVPDDQSLAYDDAYAMAMNHLSQQSGWSQEKADLLLMVMNALYQPNDMDHPVWFFYFERHSLLENNEYSNEKYYKKYEEKLRSMFGGTAPICVGVVMNAMTGELEEPIMMDYPPVRFHYADFILRPAPFLGAVAEKKAAEGWD